jgi:hypothetical protein
MILAWLLLLTGLTISAVAIYYSVVGLTAIFSAAVIPIIIMGSALEVGKLVCASWLKANWERAPRFMKYYMVTAVIVLMIITSMGIFGFLSKAHNDQNLVSGDVQSKIAIYDEKIKTERENIDANRKVLKQLDESVDQVMGRSQDEKGAEKAVAIRRAQQKERSRIAQDIAEAQKRIASLNEERAPIAAEVRKVEAEVGPIKYIAKFIYGEHGADENSLERAVTWIIILIVIVFDPLAVIMLLAAQMTFGWRKEEPVPTIQELDTDVGEKPTAEEILTQGVTNSNPEDNVPLTTDFEGVREPGGEWIQTGPSFEVPVEQTHREEVPSETPSTALGGDITAPEEPVVDTTESELDKWNKMIEEAEQAIEQEKKEKSVQEEARKYHPEPDFPEGRLKPDLTEVIESEESKKKTYMIKDPEGNIQIKSRE